MTVLEGRRVVLRPYTSQDFPILYELAIDPIAGRRFRWGGSTPNPEDVARTAWDGVLLHLIIVERSSGEPIGISTISSPNFQQGYAHASVLMVETGRKVGLGMEGFGLMIGYAFRTWPFRKIYCDVLEETFDQFRTGGQNIYEVEGCRREHHFVDGRYQDLYTLTIWRTRWEATAARFAEVRATARSAATHFDEDI